MKKIFTALLFIFATLPCVAQKIVVEKDGNSEAFEFNSLDKITFNDNVVNIKLTDGNNISATMGEISRISFSDYNNIDEIEMQAKEFVKYISSDIIAVNSKAGSIVTIYDIIGSQVLCARLACDNGTIGIASLPKGIYIIKTEDQTAKFVKR